MNNIKTYQDLLDAKKQLESELATHKAQIRTDVEQLKEAWKPLSVLLSGLGKVPSNKVHPLLSIGINLLGNALLQNFLPTRSGKIATALMPMVSRGFINLINRFKNHEPKVLAH